jgi:hypothetical protein
MRDKPLLLGHKGLKFFQVGASFKPNLGKGLWYPKLKHFSGWVLTSGNLEAQTSKRVV